MLKCPRGFRPVDKVAEVELSAEPAFVSAAQAKAKGVQRQGILYERRVHDYLTARYGRMYIRSPWLRFRGFRARQWRDCQPDGIIYDLQALHVSIVEVKLRHTAQAWWQLRKLYEPVIAGLFGPDVQTAVCEVTKSFDPHTQFPEPIRLVPEPHRPGDTQFGIHVFNGRL